MPYLELYHPDDEMSLGLHDIQLPLTDEVGMDENTGVGGGAGGRSACGEGGHLNELWPVWETLDHINQRWPDSCRVRLKLYVWQHLLVEVVGVTCNAARVPQRGGRLWSDSYRQTLCCSWRIHREG